MKFCGGNILSGFRKGIKSNKHPRTEFPNSHWGGEVSEWFQGGLHGHVTWVAAAQDLMLLNIRFNALLLFLKFLRILSLLLCFAPVVWWDTGACKWAEDLHTARACQSLATCPICTQPWQHQEPRVLDDPQHQELRRNSKGAHGRVSLYKEGGWLLHQNLLWTQEQDHGVLGSVNTQGTLFILSCVILCISQQLTLKMMPQKEKENHAPRGSFPVSPSVLIGELQVQCQYRVWVYSKMEAGELVCTVFPLF